MKRALIRGFCLALTVLLMLGLCAAQADTISEFRPLEEDQFSSYSVCTYGSNYMATGAKGSQLFNAGGEAISEVYDQMYQVDHVYRVWRSTGFGLIDAVTGKELVPCRYGYAEPLGKFDDWYVGYTVERVDEDYDITDIEDKNYHVRIITTDVYHGDQLVATLPREKFNGGTSASQKLGNYLWITPDREKWVYTTYDASFTELRTVDTTSEYEERVNEGKIIHVATGTEAFTKDCTLRPEDVSVPYQVNNFSENGVDILDLQGNVVLNFPKGTYDYVTNYNQYSNGYLLVKKDGKYGLVNVSTGKETVPCVMDSYSYDSFGFFAAGYQYVVTDGKIAVYNDQGEIVLTTEINPEETRVRAEADGLLLAVGDYGDYQLLSVTDGYFDGKYKEYIVRGRTVRVTDLEDHVYLMDIHGHVIRDMAEYSYCELSGDGTTVIAKDAENYLPHIAVITRGE